MALNKIVYGSDVLIDLTGDTVSEDTLAKGITAHDKSGEVIVGTSTKDSDTSDADVAVAEILDGKIAYARGAKLIGTMPNNGSIKGTITTKEQKYNIPLGFHDGTGTVEIDSVEREKLIPINIREGVTILGVEGTMSGSEEERPQDKTVRPTKTQQVVLPDEGYTCLRQVTVEGISYVETPNAAGGVTATIAGV